MCDTPRAACYMWQ